jgi:Holliday junction resolvase RusA-like endonuclease
MGKLIFIKGKPIGKGRPRFTKIGRVYTPKKTKDYEKSIATAYVNEDGKYYEEGTPVHISLSAYFMTPKSYSKKLVRKLVKAFAWFLNKPDIDNIIKSVLDGLNNVAYHDDSQVCSIEASKHWTDDPEKEGLSIMVINADWGRNETDD